MLTVLVRGSQHLGETLTRPREPRHDGANGYARHRADLLIGEPLKLAQHDHLPEFRRQLVERLRKRRAGRAPREYGFRMLLADCLAVQSLVKLHRRKVSA